MQSDSKQSQAPDHVSFGPFELAVRSRLLLRDGSAVQIGSRSLDLLVALVTNAGEIVGKRDLVDRVWPGLTVDDGSLRVHINGLRKALGDGHDGARYVANVPGRGYSFVAPVLSRRAPVEGTNALTSSKLDELPAALARMVGRDEAVQALSAQVLTERFVSLVGPGGIGKTTVAVKAAHGLRDEFEGAIRFINLSVVADPGLVLVTIASTLGLNSSLGDAVAGIVAFLQQRRTLLVLDSCEHLLEPIAFLADAIFQQVPTAYLLITSREALRVEGERVTRLTPLDIPPEAEPMTAAACLAYPAVELFVERASASETGFKLNDEDARIVVEICRKLDGIALAIELAAGRVEAYGLAGTAQLLDSRLGLLWHGRRTAPSRHQTLQAMLDWSFGLLHQTEQAVFIRLAIFTGTFSLRAAQAVAADAVIDQVEVADVLASLVAKSLLAPVAGGASRRYRLLDTTRTYAREKLVGSGHHPEASRRHAQFVAAGLTGSVEGERSETPEGFLRQLSDIRSALEWCFLDSGDRALGIAIAAAAATPFLECSLFEECYQWSKRALECLDVSERGSAIELDLQTSLGWSALFAAGKSDVMRTAFLRGLEIADIKSDPHQQLRLLGGMNIILTRECDYVGALESAKRSADIARSTGDVHAVAMAEWTLGVCHHLCGHHAVVGQFCDSAVAPPKRSPYARKVVDYGYDHRGRALIARARSLWLRGYPDQAIAAGHFAIATAEDLGHPVSLCIALVYSATVFIWCRDWVAADAALDRLVTHSQVHTLMYRDVGIALREIAAEQRRTSGSVSSLQKSLDDLRSGRHFIIVPMCCTALAEALLEAGRDLEAGNVIDAVLDDLGPDMVSVDGPEVLRFKGQTEAALGRFESSEAFIRKAITLARKQSALSWELRATMSLMRTRKGRARKEAASMLSSVYSQFKEGFGTGDLTNALELLNMAQ